MHHRFITGIAAAILAVAIAPIAAAQSPTRSSTADEIARYRQMLADDNPAELWEARGAELWKKKAGPKNASLELCDLGKGPGMVRGAYAELPRYFSDTDRVMDLEQRLVTCRTTLQGLSPAEAVKTPFGSPGNPSAIEALVAYLAGQSRGMKMAATASHPAEKRAYEIGRQMFYFRGGSHGFACATCHSASAQRIRLQQLPNLLEKKDAQLTYATWPAYRVSQGEVRSMQHRLYDCYRQQRFPEPGYASDSLTALTMYLAKNAEGAVYDGPAMKR